MQARLRNLVLSAPWLLGVLCTPSSGADGQSLHAGPILGPVGERDAAVWIQTEDAADVQVRFFSEAAHMSVRLTQPIHTVAASDFAATFLLTGLTPGTSYGYEVYLNGEIVRRPYSLALKTQPLWRSRTPPPEFTLVFGSCAYINDPPYDRPGAPYAGDYQIFEAMADQRPELMIWLGDDNIYTREGDLGSAAGIHSRYRHDRATAELQRLFAATSHYAIWDDHDYGPNDGDRSFALKTESLAAFNLYWPSLGRGTPSTPGVFQRFSWGDVDFFLLDDRYYRAPDRWPSGPDKRMLGASQLEWLKDGLVSSEATFKVIALGNQALNPRTSFETFANYSGEQAEVLDWIRDRHIDGVIFISGDRHHSELVRLDRKNAYPLYDFTSSPLTSRVHSIGRSDPEFENPYRVDGTLLEEHSFGALHFEGLEGERRAVLRAFDKSGNLKWERTLSQKDRAFPPQHP